MKKRISYISSIFLIVLFVGVFQSCDRDCPTCPDDNPPEPGNYRLYVINEWYNTLISIDTPADTVIDSISLDYESFGLYLTPDGNRLLVGNGDAQEMEVYSAADLSHIETIDQYGDYYFDKTDNIGIYYAGLMEKIYFIDPYTLVPFDSISRGIFGGSLDTATNLFIANKSVSTNIIYFIDCDSRALTDSIDLGLYAWDLAYSWATNEIYFHGSPGLGSAFFAYDLNLDSITLAIGTINSTGSIAISPDGSQVYMNDGGDGMHFEYPRGDIWVIGTGSHELVELIPPFIFPSGESISLPTFGDIILSPDDTRAYIAANGTTNGYQPIAVVDLSAGKIINGILNDENFWAKDIVLGPVPD